MRDVTLVTALAIFSVTACTTAPTPQAEVRVTQDSGLEKVSIVALGLE